MTPDYAAGTQRMARLFARRGIDRATAQDLTQDTWVRYLEATQRGSLQARGDGLEPLAKMAGWTLAEWRRRPAAREEITRTGEFTEEARLIQLYTDADSPKLRYRVPRAKGTTRPPEVVTAVRGDRAQGMSLRALAAKHSIPVASISQILRMEAA